MPKWTPFAIVSCLGLVYCASTERIPLTGRLIKSNALTTREVTSLQAYNSHEIILKREVLTSSRTALPGELQVTADKVVEELIIPESTPGIMTAIAPDFTIIAVSFERGTEPLLFDLVTDECESPYQYSDCVVGRRRSVHIGTFAGDSFVDKYCIALRSVDWVTEGIVAAKDDDGHFVFTSSIAYDGKTWEALEHSALACIEIDRRKFSDLIEKSRTLDGYTLDERPAAPSTTDR